MTRFSHRLLLLALGAGAVISCDTRLPTASRRAVAGTPPSVVIDSPIVNTQVNLGDSIFMLVEVTGGNGLRTLTLSANALTGDPNLGTFLETPRYTSVSVTFPPGTTDTTIRRYLKVINPGDQTLDSLLIRAIAVDSAGLVDTSSVRAAIVSGPHVTIDSPAANDSIPSGVGISIATHATDVDGIGRITLHVIGDPSWPTKLDTTIVAVYDGSSRDVVFTTVVNIPGNATPRSRVTVNASSLDAVRQPGSAAPISLFIRSNASIPAPRVTQVVPPRSERGDTVIVTANGQGIVSVGLLVRDSAGNLVRADTTPMPPPITSNVQVGIPLQLTLAQQGQRLAITAFAIDQIGRIGYAVRSSTAGSETVLANATVDSTQVVYGQTYTMPLQGVVGDVAVDTVGGHVFMSNKSHNRLEVWSNTTRTFSPTGIAVGSEPWGLTLTAKAGDSLLVANSGATDISRVCILNCIGGVMTEDAANRMRTRNIFVYKVTESLDASSGKITITVQDPPTSYSDRPQYIAQSSTGRIFFSTVPTPTAGLGTIRWLDPSAGPAPDPRLIWQYGDLEGGTQLDYIIFNVDSINIKASATASSAPDALFMYDHDPGTVDPTKNHCVINIPPPPAPDPNSVCVRSTTDGAGVVFDASIEAVIATMRSLGSDIEEKLRLNLESIGLTDTTFVASSFNKNWIAFGEGNTAGAGRVMLTADSIGLPGANKPQFFSPNVTVSDLTDNASERVFGLALDRSGKIVASHGSQSYLAAVDPPFHLRLLGQYDSFDDGAGIAIHPDADGQNSIPDTKRLAFVASSSGKIEIVDILHFGNRGTLQLKYPIYGPLRASKPMPGDDPSIVLKLFAITTRGLVVIDLTAADIKPPPQ